MKNKELLESYKSMNASASMEDKIKAYLAENCAKYAGNECHFSDCIRHLTECAREILGGKNGNVDDAVCYRICMDYFNDEMWAEKSEPEKSEKAKPEKPAKKKAPESTAPVTAETVKDDVPEKAEKPQAPKPEEHAPVETDDTLDEEPAGHRYFGQVSMFDVPGFC